MTNDTNHRFIWPLHVVRADGLLKRQVYHQFNVEICLPCDYDKSIILQAELQAEIDRITMQCEKIEADICWLDDDHQKDLMVWHHKLIQQAEELRKAKYIIDARIKEKIRAARRVLWIKEAGRPVHDINDKTISEDIITSWLCEQERSI